MPKGGLDFTDAADEELVMVAKLVAPAILVLVERGIIKFPVTQSKESLVHSIFLALDKLQEMAKKLNGK